MISFLSINNLKLSGRKGKSIIYKKIKLVYLRKIFTSLIKMKSIVLPAYNGNVLRAMLGLKVMEVDIPKISDEEVLVKIAAAPCNPSDIAFMQGKYNVVKKLPALMGFEGSGVVVDAGNNTVAKSMMGKRVACFTQSQTSGTWTEFAKIHYKNCIPARDAIDDEQASTLYINPITAIGLIEYAKQKKAKAIVQNAAGGQLASFIRMLAKKEDITVVNIVRKPEQQQKIIDQDNSIVLCSATDNFEEELVETIKAEKVDLCFDAVGGEEAAQLFNALEPNSDLLIYGGLSNKDIAGLNTMDIIFKNKKILGFNALDWIGQKNESDFLELTNKIQSLFEEKFIQTSISGIYSFDEVVKGLKYYIQNMSEGKILIKPTL
ncbi:MAG: hypothetical protein C0594_12540 [Marinilabiliales bacterium]|nr:MAG: hypothetical protein C0594_12540 [Marinilabiliales bacterium]